MGGRVRIDPPEPHGPIWIRCEGSGCPPAGRTIASAGNWLLCSMCGAPVSHLALTDDGMVSEHYRDDIIARIERGDFEPGAEGDETGGDRG